MQKEEIIYLLSMIVVLVLPIVLLVFERIDDRLINIMEKNNGVVVFRFRTLVLIFRYVCIVSSFLLLFYHIYYGMSQGIYFIKIYVFFAILCLVGFICYILFRSFRVCFLYDCIIDRRYYRKGTKINNKDIRCMVKSRHSVALKDKHKKVLVTWRFSYKVLEKLLKERYGFRYEK